MLAIALVLVGCSTPPTEMGMDHSPTPSAASSSTAKFNDPDVAFATNMIAHHQQAIVNHHQGAIDMAQQELGAGKNRDALALAQKIIDAQTAEITTMQDILNTL